MSLWIPVTILAAFAQNLRFMLQKHLKSTQLSTGGATFARFVFSAPLVMVIVLIYMAATGQGWPTLSASFFMFAISGGAGQILATACVVALFAERNFSVGIVFKKTEVVQTALLGLVILGEGLGSVAILAIAIGFVGVVLLSDPPSGGSLFNKAAGLGLSSGFLFGISAIGYRGAALELATDDVLLRAGVTLAIVTAMQTAAMMAYLALREPGELQRVAQSWRVSSLVGLTSMVGSYGWFLAFSLQNAAYVKALGQIELVFTFLGSYFIFKERSGTKELTGITLIVVSIFVLILALR
ncbi:MAG: DMT family transporter [Pseudomonadota bacterium]